MTIMKLKSKLKPRGQFLAAATVAIFAFMGFTTGALGQGVAEGGSVGVSPAFMTQTFSTHPSPAVLVLALEGGLRRPVQQHPAPQPPSNGCGNNNGWDQRGGGKCTAVPEGGTTFAYLALIGLCCVATAILSIRRRARATN
jgi:hypothetical protein